MRIKKCVLIEKKEEDRLIRYVLRSLDTGNDIHVLEDHALSMYEGGIYDLNGEQMGRTFELVSFSENGKAIEKKLIATGISKELSSLLFSRFGGRVFEVINNTPEEMESIKGIGRKRASTICENYRAYEAGKDHILLVSLQTEYDLSDKVARAVQAKFKGKLQSVADDPYLLCEVKEIPFAKIDQVYMKKTRDLYDVKRMRAAAKIAIKRYCRSTGSMAAPPDAVVEGMAKLLGLEISETAIKASINQLIRDRVLFYQYRMIYDEWHCQIERESAKRLALLSVADVKQVDLSEDILKHCEMRCKIELDDKQREGVYTSLKHPITLITGGPGTGKSTLINVILEVIRKCFSEAVIALLAPTGRAASRMAEITGETASTIHSALHLSLDEESDTLERIEEADVVIVDETSMVSMALAHKILIAVKRGSRLIFIGDPNQLPSVQEGAFLRDLVALGKEGVIGYVALRRIFRQGSGSNIPLLAESIIKGNIDRNSIEKDIKAISLSEPTEIARAVLSVIRQYLNMGVKLEDIMVLAPIKKKEASPLSTYHLNGYLQDALNAQNSNHSELKHNGTLYREGSRVIQTVNIQEAMNGDLGQIKSVKENEVKVKFDSGKEKTYARNELPDLELAFSITVHKSQGSQFPVVILPLHASYQCMAKKDIYYTAVTRASKALLLIGDLSVLDKASRTPGKERISFFGYRVLSFYGNGTVREQENKRKQTIKARESEKQLYMFDELGNVS